MFPIRINLLSTEKRKYLNRMIYIQFIKNTFISIVFVFCISGITLLGGQSVLQEYFSEVSNGLTLAGGINAEQNKKIRDINSLIRNVEAVQEVHNLWSQKIVELSNIVPDKVTFSNMILNKETQGINISGVAKDRESLLEFKDNINNLDFIKNIEIPLSQLTEKEDIKFSISIEMK